MLKRGTGVDPPVRLLDPHTINQIAAGEVVERPASVVKELVENALDAGATRITVELIDAGRTRIRVTDNGGGMSSENLQASLQRHATSKIRSAKDLQKAITLGFRGEAIPSIASVSQFKISTATEDGLRHSIAVSGGAAGALSHESGPKGTEVTVDELFFNTPARLKFMKSDGTELSQISEIIGKFAVAYPAVAFRLTHGNHVMLESPGDNNLLSAIAAAWGRESVRTLNELDFVREGVRVRGFISGPEVTRATRSQQWAFVNGRPVKNRALFSAIDSAFRMLTPDKRFPLAVLFIDIDPSRIDANVSPTKSEVRFQQEGAIFDAIRSACKQALLSGGMIPSADAIARANFAIGASSASPAPAYTSLPPNLRGPGAQGVFDTALVGTLYDPYVGSAGPGGGLLGNSEEGAGAQINSGQERGFSQFLDGLRVLGQTSDCFFIIAENTTGVMIIDQHVAHERILYEKLKAERSQSPLPRQPLLTPIPVEFDRRLSEVVTEHLAMLTHSGFDLEPFGAQSFLLRGVPSAIRREDPLKVFRDLIDDLVDGTRGGGLTPTENLWVMCACKLAIKAGERLSMPEMERLLQDLAQSENPYLCPHGRPITLMLSRYDLMRKFKRI